LFPLFENWLHAAAIFAVAFAALKVFEYAWSKRGFKEGLLEKAVIFGQSLDGAASCIGIAYPPAGTSYFEQHVVGGALMGAFSPFAFLALKLAFAFAAIWLLRREKEEERNFVLILIAVFGLAPGLRDALRIAAGV